MTDGGAGGNPTALPGFETGDFFVQDEASQLCVRALDARVRADCGGRVAPAPAPSPLGCAVHGRPGARAVLDLHASKLSLVRSGAGRLGLHCLEVACRDARSPDPSLLGGC